MISPNIESDFLQYGWWTMIATQLLYRLKSHSIYYGSYSISHPLEREIETSYHRLECVIKFPIYRPVFHSLDKFGLTRMKSRFWPYHRNSLRPSPSSYCHSCHSTFATNISVSKRELVIIGEHIQPKTVIRLGHNSVCGLISFIIEYLQSQNSHWDYYQFNNSPFLDLAQYHQWKKLDFQILPSR